MHSLQFHTQFYRVSYPVWRMECAKSCLPFAIVHQIRAPKQSDSSNLRRHGGTYTPARPYHITVALGVQAVNTRAVGGSP
jgi:hypothetical protein